MSDEPEIYLDHAASSPLLPTAAEAWFAAAREHHANPTGIHSAARRARRALDAARRRVAEALGASPGEIVFTSGGSEADNTAITGALNCFGRGGVAVTTAVEHHAVLDAVERSDNVIVKVDERGVVDLEDLSRALRSRSDIAVVSVIAVNNETGSIAPLCRVARLVRSLAPQALLHTDAVQAVNWIDVAEETADYDLVSVAGHKVGSPIGIGALVVRGGVKLRPLIIGGGQQRGRRAGTPDVAGAVAFAAALESTVARRGDSVRRVRELRDMIFDGLSERLEGRVVVSAAGDDGADRSHIAAGIANVCITGVQSDALLFLIDQGGVRASAASSCSSGAQNPSHVLEAMGVPRRMSKGSLRLSLGYTTTESEVERAVEVIVAAVERLDRFGGG